MLVDIEAVELMTKLELQAREQIIERGKQTFVEVGKVLAEIRDRKGYRFTYGTFEDYCKEKWGWTVRTGQLYIAAAKTVENLQQLPENTKPVSHLDYSKAAVLSTLTPEEQVNFVRENNVAEMTKRELQEAIKARKAAEKAAKEAEQKLLKAESETETERKRAAALEARLGEMESQIPEPEVIETTVEVIKEVIPPDVQEKLTHVNVISSELDKVSRENKLLKMQLEVANSNPDDERLKLETKVSIFTGRIKQFLRDMGHLGYTAHEVMRTSPRAQQEYEDSIMALEKWCRDMRDAMIRPEKSKIIDVEVS